MMTIAVIALVSLVGLLFTFMAVAPALFEATASKAESHADLVLIEPATLNAGDMEHPRAA